MRAELPKEEAIARFEQEDEPYKAEIAAGLAAELPISTYTCGDFYGFVQRAPCAGHKFHQGLQADFLSGSLLARRRKNRMLSRIYGTAFPDAKTLAAHLEKLEQAKARDHRKLGRELSLLPS